MRKPDFKKLQEAIDANDLERINQLLTDSDVDVNARNNYEETPLHYALRVHPNPEIIRAVLYNRRVDVNAQEKNGHTPFHYALMQECIKTEGHINLEIVNVFLNNYAVTLEISDNFELMPLEYIIYNRQVIEAFYTTKRAEAILLAAWADRREDDLRKIRRANSIILEQQRQR